MDGERVWMYYSQIRRKRTNVYVKRFSKQLLKVEERFSGASHVWNVTRLSLSEPDIRIFIPPHFCKILEWDKLFQKIQMKSIEKNCTN